MANETPKILISEREQGPQGWQCSKCRIWVDVLHGLTGDEIATLVMHHKISGCDRFDSVASR